MTFAQQLAAVALGRIRSSDLPTVAAQGLAEGHESPALAALAGMQSRECSPRELEDLFHRALDQVKQTLPDRVRAARILTHGYAELAAQRLLDPRNAAAALVRLVRDVEDVLPHQKYLGDGLGLAEVVGLYYSHDDVPGKDERAHAAIDADLQAELERIARDGLQPPTRHAPS